MHTDTIDIKTSCKTSDIGLPIIIFFQMLKCRGLQLLLATGRAQLFNLPLSLHCVFGLRVEG